ncbi:MAG: Flp pilus assembly protein CpaB [Candidatus Pacebacteria bacterium]|nr:Flp pilus assembly protein CpaB [Candidatus Paceibacterota bacterium]
MQAKLKDKIPLLVAIVFGLIAVLAVNHYVKRQTETPEVEKANIIVSTADLQPGERIEQEDIGTEAIPAKMVSQVHITLPGGRSPMEADEAQRTKMRLIGRKVARKIPAGEAILWSDLTGATPTTLASKLQEGLRAVSVPVDDVSAVGLNVVPGDRVDILATLRPKLGQGIGSLIAAAEKGGELPGKGVHTVTVMLMQNVGVLATGTDHTPPGVVTGKSVRGYSTLTLQVTPKEAALLTHARQHGEMSFILRHPESLDRLASPSEAQVTNEQINEKISNLDTRRAELIEIIQKGRVEPHAVFEDGSDRAEE